MSQVLNISREMAKVGRSIDSDERKAMFCNSLIQQVAMKIL